MYFQFKYNIQVSTKFCISISLITLPMLCLRVTILSRLPAKSCCQFLYFYKSQKVHSIWVTCSHELISERRDGKIVHLSFNYVWMAGVGEDKKCCVYGEIQVKQIIRDWQKNIGCSVPGGSSLYWPLTHSSYTQNQGFVESSVSRM